MHAALDTYVLQPLTGSPTPWTIPHHTGKDGDRAATRPAAGFADPPPESYDKEVAFDILTSVSRSNTNHEHDQPAHLKVNNPGAMRALNHALYDGPEGRYCPARVYEWVEDGDGKPSLVINAQNCLHCKACAIKDVGENILWRVPEGGGGPGYTLM